MSIRCFLCLQCVCHCVDTITGLLRLAHTKSVPGADDILPVFIYVLIQANPQYLLSTLQVNKPTLNTAGKINL